MAQSEDISRAFERFCTEHGLKKTVQRRVVFEFFHGGGIHPSVEDAFRKIRKKLPTIKEESLYRILSDFEKFGYIRRVDVPGIIRYELACRLHGHFVCTECGRIVDIDNVDVRLPAELCGAENVCITVNGVCPKCAGRASK